LERHAGQPSSASDCKEDLELLYIPVMEHRHAPRHRVFSPVRLIGPCEQNAGVISNICRDGLFIRVAMDLEIGKCVELRIPRLHNGGSPLDLTALVVHREGGGFGLMFLGYDDRIDAVIARVTL
jgi:hypothetical protein